MKFTTKQKTIALSCMAILGNAATAVIAAYRQEKYKEILEECDGNKVKAVIRTHWPTALAMATTDAVIVAAEVLGIKEIAAISGAAAYAISKKDAILSSLDKATVKDVTKEIDKEYVPQALEKYPSFEETGYGDLLCFEGYSGRWFRSSLSAVKDAINRFNDRWAEGEYLSLNDFYHELGIADTHFGHEYGWANSSDWYDVISPIDIQIEMLEKGECKFHPEEKVLVIEIYSYPMLCWLEV